MKDPIRRVNSIESLLVELKILYIYKRRRRKKKRKMLKICLKNSNYITDRFAELSFYNIRKYKVLADSIPVYKLEARLFSYTG